MEVAMERQSCRQRQEQRPLLEHLGDTPQEKKREEGKRRRQVALPRIRCFAILIFIATICGGHEDGLERGHEDHYWQRRCRWRSSQGGATNRGRRRGQAGIEESAERPQLEEKADRKDLQAEKSQSREDKGMESLQRGAQKASRLRTGEIQEGDERHRGRDSEGHGQDRRARYGSCHSRDKRGRRYGHGRSDQSRAQGAAGFSTERTVQYGKDAGTPTDAVQCLCWTRCTWANALRSKVNGKSFRSQEAENGNGRENRTCFCQSGPDVQARRREREESQEVRAAGLTGIEQVGLAGNGSPLVSCKAMEQCCNSGYTGARVNWLTGDRSCGKKFFVSAVPKEAVVWDVCEIRKSRSWPMSLQFGGRRWPQKSERERNPGAIFEKRTGTFPFDMPDFSITNERQTGTGACHFKAAIGLSFLDDSSSICFPSLRYNSERASFEMNTGGLVGLYLSDQEVENSSCLGQVQTSLSVVSQYTKLLEFCGSFLLVVCLVLHFRLLKQIKRLAMDSSLKCFSRRAQLREHACMSVCASLLESATVRNIFRLTSDPENSPWKGLLNVAILCCLLVWVAACFRSCIRTRKDCIGVSNRAGQARQPIRGRCGKGFSWIGVFLCLNIISAHACEGINKIPSQPNHQDRELERTDDVRQTVPDIDDGIVMMQGQAGSHDKRHVHVTVDNTSPCRQERLESIYQRESRISSSAEPSSPGPACTGMPSTSNGACPDKYDSGIHPHNVTRVQDYDSLLSEACERGMQALPEAIGFLQSDNTSPSRPCEGRCYQPVQSWDIEGHCPLSVVGNVHPTIGSRVEHVDHGQAFLGNFCRHTGTRP